MSRLELSEQARKILERERSALEQEAGLSSAKLTTPASVLSTVCKLLNVRGRYFAITGEHFSVQDYDGLCIIDTLDEHLMKLVNKLLKDYLEHEKRVPKTEVVAVLAEKLLQNVKEMPKYPVAYRLLFLLRQAFETFENLLDSSPGFDTHELESAFLHHLLGISDKYVQTRERHGMRHFSDVAREYDFVARMKCKCGEGQFQVKLQALVQEAEAAYDRLELECRACGHQRSITFDLPYFRDLYQA